MSRLQPTPCSASDLYDPMTIIISFPGAVAVVVHLKLVVGYYLYVEGVYSLKLWSANEVDGDVRFPSST